MKILIFAFCGIGDMVNFTPALRCLRKTYPGSAIDIVVRNNGPREFLNNEPGINEIIVYPENFIIDPMHKTHSLEQNLKLLESLGCIAKDTKPLLTLREEEKRFAERFLSESKLGKTEIIGIHPGSERAGKIRRWPVERFCEVIDKINKKTKAKTIVFFGPEEMELKIEFEKRVGDKAAFAAFSDLRETMAVISKCSLMLTSDSGLGHIANALGVSAVAIFGPANYLHTRPYGEKNIVISKHVICSPCNYLKKGFICPYDRKCLMQITSDEVFDKAKKFLG